MGVWIFLILVPMIPVGIFYAIFSDQNYFELENAGKGIVATGPIAAYFALVWLGARLYKGVSSDQPRLSDAEERLLGTSWDFNATSQHGSERKGSFTVTSASDGGLELKGNFEMADETQVGDWRSTMTRCEDGRLQILYDLSDSGKGAEERSTGMLSLHAKAVDPRQMSGRWVVLGRADAQGQMTCRKVK
jgi:hypothetical protein